MKKLIITNACIILLFLLLSMSIAIPLCQAQAGNSQDFSPSRFVVMAAQVNVFSPRQGGAQDTQYVIIKLDTTTGKSWILQLDVAGGNDPKVRHSEWKELDNRR